MSCSDAGSYRGELAGAAVSASEQHTNPKLGWYVIAGVCEDVNDCQRLGDLSC